MPSTYTTGAPPVSELAPRMRMSAAAPGIPEFGRICTPTVLPWSSSVSDAGVVFSVMSAASSVVMELPSVRLETAPAVPVTTISSIAIAEVES
jgi:hypothetical protein